MARIVEAKNIEITHAISRVRVVIKDTAALYAAGEISREEYEKFWEILGYEQEQLMELISAVDK